MKFETFFFCNEDAISFKGKTKMKQIGLPVQFLLQHRSGGWFACFGDLSNAVVLPTGVCQEIARTTSLII